MKEKIRVTIAGRNYLLAADENTGYIEKVAEYVGDQIAQAEGMARFSAVDAATMAAMNIADGYFREREAAENLRHQLKEALDESAGLKREISELKRENFRLSQGK